MMPTFDLSEPLNRVPEPRNPNDGGPDDEAPFKPLSDKQVRRMAARLKKLTAQAYNLACEIEGRHVKGEEIYRALAGNALVNAADAEAVILRHLED